MEAFATLTTPHQNQATRPRGHEHTKLVELLGALCKKKKWNEKKSSNLGCPCELCRHRL